MKTYDDADTGRPSTIYPNDPNALITIEDALLKEASKDSINVEEFLKQLKRGLLKKSAPSRR